MIVGGEDLFSFDLAAPLSGAPNHHEAADDVMVGLPSAPDSGTLPPTRCWKLGSIVFAQYFLLALDIRFVATRNFAGIVVVNALLAIMGWYVVRGIVQAHTVRERLSYVVGATSGAVLAVWLT